MEEKKLTDEEIVKDIERSTGMPSYWKKIVLDLIHRQKAEIERLTSLYDGKTGFMTSSIGDLPLTVEGLRKAIDEISRLLLVQGELQELNAKYYNEAKDLRRENGELQQQVDELKTENTELYKEHTTLIAGSILEKQDIVKNTTKEILKEIENFKHYAEKSGRIADKLGANIAIKTIKETLKSKGVEVE